MPSCDIYRSELTRLQGVSRTTAPEIARLNAYRQQIGCLNENGFFSMPNPACGAIDQRIRYLIAYSSQDDAVAQRRHELQRLVRAACSNSAPKVETVSQKSYGGKLVCVRSCDGAFFPLDATMRKGVDPDEYCQALCPGTEASAYSMPSQDDGLKDASALHSKASYSALPNAFLFQKKRVASCTCAVEDRPWSASLLKAEDYLTRHRKDVIVTAALADELSQPNANMAKILASRPVGKFEVAQRSEGKSFVARGQMQLRYAGEETSRRQQKKTEPPPQETATHETTVQETVEPVREKAATSGFAVQGNTAASFSSLR